ncbi:MAG: thiopurine S-methyltransferase [Deltaproteobacteria bacterium]|nr:thiopurine S-methyltransferase [Deltaproteobacteria bacterium]
MQPEFWKSRWSEGKIGFHEGTPNHFLTRHAGRIADRRRVLVPLCGKAEDLAFLAAHDHEVIGIELVEDAVRAFFTEHGATPTIVRRGPVAIYTADAITIIAGDLFTVTEADVGAIDVIYDRAAIIALPPELRARYVEHLHTLVPARTTSLLITLEYPQDQHAGPPFSVPEAEVRELFSSAELIDERPATGPVANAGLAAIERCYLATVG